MHINEFRPQTKYCVLRGFSDAENKSVEKGATVTYSKKHYSTYDEEYTLEFNECCIVLNENMHKEILNNLGSYFEPLAK